MGACIEFDDGVSIVIPSYIMTSLSQMLATRGFARESGGILLGKQITGTLAFELTDASLPSRYDVGKRFSFLRKMQPANRLISSAWRESNGTINYLGEWHTHNQANPVPSITDTGLMQQVVVDGSLLLARGFMLILGNADCAYIGAVNPSNDKGIYCERRIKWER